MNYYGYIYKTTDRMTNKIYVGQRKGEFDPKYKGSGKKLKPELKNRPDDFSVELVTYCRTLEELNCYEVFNIKRLDARNPDVGYNISMGGKVIPRKVNSKLINRRIKKRKIITGYRKILRDELIKLRNRI